MDFYLVYVTTADNKKAKILAKKILQERLCACINIIPKIESLYYWQNNIEKNKESLMIIKTTASKKDRLFEYIKNNHSYTTPEIIAVKIDDGDKNYLSWINENI